MSWTACTLSTAAKSEMDSSVLLYRPHKNPLMRWDPNVYYHNEGSAFRKAQIWKTMVEKKLKPRCTEWQNVHFFKILTLKVLCHLWCFCVYVCICGVFWLLNDSNAFILFFSWCFLKLLDSLSIISPNHHQKMQTVLQCMLQLNLFDVFMKCRLTLQAATAFRLNID